MATVAELLESEHWVIRMPPAVVNMTDDQFFELCQANRDLRLERTAEGDILIMTPAGSESSHLNLAIAAQLHIWAKRDGTGVAFESSAGFRLPNKATRNPDAAWVLKARLKGFSREEKKKFLALCPDFVVELKSPTDRLADLKDKMEEYIANGARLGWLVDPDGRRVFVYRPGEPAQCLENPLKLAGDPVLPGFLLDLKEIWEPDI
jgi:Uma2 family endonuclease